MSAENSRMEIEQMRKKFITIGWTALAIGVAAIALTIIGTIWTGYDLTSDAVSRVQDSQNRELSLKIQIQNDKLKEFQVDLDEVKSQLTEISYLLNKSNQRIEESDDTETP